MLINNTIRETTQEGLSCAGTKENEGVKMRHDMKERSICKYSIRYVNI